MRKSRRRLIFGTVLITALLACAVLLVIPLVVSTGWARERLENALREKTDRRVEVGNVAFGWFRGLTAKEVVIHQQNAADEKVGPLFRFEKLSLKVPLSALMKKTLVFDEVRVEKPSMAIIRGTDGSFNFDDLLDPNKRLPDFTAEVEARNARVHFVDRKAGTRFTAEDTRAELTWTKGQMQLEATFKLNGGPSKLSVSGDFRGARPKLAVQEMKIDNAALDVSLAHLGYIVPLAGLRPESATGTFWLDIGELRGPAALAGRGTIELDGATLVSGPMIELYETIRPMLTKAPPLKNMKQKITSKFTIGGGKVSTEELRVDADGLNLVLAGSTSFDGALDYHVKIAQLPEATQFYLRGTLAHPRIELDKAPLFEEAKRRTEEEVKKRAPDVLEAIKREIRKRVLVR